LYLLLLAVAVTAKASPKRWPDPPTSWLQSATVRCVVYRESRGQVHIPGGKWQFEGGTWRAMGGSGDAGSATEAEQDYRAWLLWRHVGCSAWCPYDGC
jgi:hypothetical protein